MTPTTPPACACGDPATQQTRIGTRATDQQQLYAWECDHCAHNTHTEREISRGS